jgi:hypothetical protein
MKALFITTQTDHEQHLVDTWTSTGEEAQRVQFELMAQRNHDEEIDKVARNTDFDIIFYSGGNAGPGLPTMSLFRKLRDRAPLVHLCWDSADEPWHARLDEYRSAFTLQVGLDGVRSAPVDHVTLYPIDPRRFESSVTMARRYKCGFAGDLPSYEDWIETKKHRLTHPHFENPRAALLYSMREPATVTIRRREQGGFSDYVEFLQSCYMALNTAHTGSGERLHMKMRHLEIPLAGCALIDTEGSPASEWFPEGSFFTYSSSADLEMIIRIAHDGEIEKKAAFLRNHVINRYSPAQIWGGILDRVRRTQ